MSTQIRNVFGAMPDNLEDFCIASQISQAEAYKFFIEMFRSQKWRRTGILWWNMIDGWPQKSATLVDYYFAKKLSYGYVKRSQADLCLMISETQNGALELVAVNDTRETTPLKYTVTSADCDQVIASGAVVAAADAATRVCTLEVSPTPAFYIIEWEADDKRGVNHYLAGKPPYDLGTFQGWLRQLGAR